MGLCRYHSGFHYEQKNTHVMSAVAFSNAEQDAVIRFEDIGRAYQMGVETIHALQGLTLTITRNEYVAIMGASGSGNSTLMIIFGFLVSPTHAQYFLFFLLFSFLNFLYLSLSLIL